MQLLKNLEPYIQQGLQVVQQLKAEEIQNEEGLEAQIYNYLYVACHPPSCLLKEHTAGPRQCKLTSLAINTPLLCHSCTQCRVQPQ